MGIPELDTLLKEMHTHMSNIISPKVNIEEGAIFIADSHYPNHGDEFLYILKKIYNKEIEAPQLFLMGDNFDLLVGGLIKSYENNIKVIELIQTISRELPIYYFEGNHDFQLSKIFTGINIYTRQKQPQYMMLKDKKVGLSHGDKFISGLGHELLSVILRNSIFIWLFSLFQEGIIRRKISYLKRKNICHNINNFEKKVIEIVSKYKDIDLIIEGHYHQAKVIGNYISLPSLACQKQVGVVRDGEIVFVDIGDL